jgi:hypothetical protein
LFYAKTLTAATSLHPSPFWCKRLGTLDLLRARWGIWTLL